MRSFYPLFVSALLACACGRPDDGGRQTIPFVRNLVMDRTSSLHTMLSSYDCNRTKSIYIIGEKSDCELFSGVLMGCDRRDNVTGEPVPDGLPDFAGENFISIQDTVNAPYTDFLQDGRELDLRELQVRLCLSSMDSLCRLSPYDRESLGRKSPSKMIILASSCSCEYGMFDIDSLYAALGCTVAVINPLQCMKRISRAGGSATVGVIAPSGMIGSGVYSGCIAFPRSGQGDELLSFLDKYLDAGYTKPLDALVIDDHSICREALDSTMNRIMSVMHEESYRYSQLISPDFRIIDPGETLADECFRLLRERNLFTHKISYPRADVLVTMRSEDEREIRLVCSD